MEFKKQESSCGLRVLGLGEGKKPPPFRTKPQLKFSVHMVTDFFHREGLLSLHPDCKFCTHSPLDPNNEMLSLLMQSRKLPISYLKCIGTNNSSNVNV